jgi:large subunit ribosomal protein L30
MSARREANLVRVTLVKSPIGCAERHKRTVRALGLRRLNQTVEHADSAVVRGMIARVRHLVNAETVAAPDETPSADGTLKSNGEV